MRTLTTLLFLVFSNFAGAGCDEIAELHTKKIYIDISDGGCATETLISFTTKISKDGQPDWESIRTVPFYEECKLAKDRSGFSCKTNGRSPLAGATYKLVEHGKSSCDPDSPGGGGPGYRYVCVKGCKKSVPRYLEQSEDCC